MFEKYSKLQPATQVLIHELLTAQLPIDPIPTLAEELDSHTQPNASLKLYMTQA